MRACSSDKSLGAVMVGPDAFGAGALTTNFVKCSRIAGEDGRRADHPAAWHRVPAAPGWGPALHKRKGDPKAVSVPDKTIETISARPTSAERSGHYRRQGHYCPQPRHDPAGAVLFTPDVWGRGYLKGSLMEDILPRVFPCTSPGNGLGPQPLPSRKAGVSRPGTRQMAPG
jgi:hypothetical protein